MSEGTKNQDEARHTPGPWRLVALRGFPAELIVAAADGDICSVACKNTPNAEEKANVRLIVAAPDLLVACKKAAFQYCASDPLNPCWDGRPTDVVGKHWNGSDACASCHARGAIAKAKGGAA